MDRKKEREKEIEKKREGETRKRYLVKPLATTCKVALIMNISTEGGRE